MVVHQLINGKLQPGGGGGFYASGTGGAGGAGGGGTGAGSPLASSPSVIHAYNGTGSGGVAHLIITLLQKTLVDLVDQV